MMRMEMQRAQTAEVNLLKEGAARPRLAKEGGAFRPHLVVCAAISSSRPINPP